MLLKQAHLKRPGESLQIQYPQNYTGAKHSHMEEEEFFIGTEPTFLTVGEIDVAQKFIADLPYRQELTLTGAVLVDPEDPLFLMTDEELDEVEAALGLESSRDPSGAESHIRERIYRIREAEPDRAVDSILRKALPVPEAKPTLNSAQAATPPPPEESKPETPEDSDQSTGQSEDLIES